MKFESPHHTTPHHKVALAPFNFFFSSMDKMIRFEDVEKLKFVGKFTKLSLPTSLFYVYLDLIQQKMSIQCIYL